MDFNKDGYCDLLAAGYAGIVYLFYGKKDGSLEEPVVLKDKTGTDIHSGMYFDFKKSNYVTVREIDNNDKLDFARAVDFDNDGDLDLLLSGKKGVKLRENIGSKRKPVFAAANIDITTKYQAYDFVDWDGDGLKDLVCGAKEGGVYYYKNTGKKKKPAFGKAVCILDKSAFENKEKGGNVGLCQVAVTDYNKDGKLDLVVGNPNTVNEKKFILTDAMRKEKAELDKQMKEIRSGLDKYMEMYAKKYDDDTNKIYAAMGKDENVKKIQDKLMPMYKKLGKYKSKGGIRHGYVFVSLRK